MKAIRLIDPGPGARLELIDAPTPQPGPDEVLIRVAYAGLNRADLMQVEGKYPPPESGIPGLEAAGDIVAVGSAVREFKTGDRVCALLSESGYAEYCTAPASQCLPVPDSMDFNTAAAWPEALFTVWLSIYMEGALKPGENLLVHGGASGIGTTAIQIATLTGNPVYATAGTDEKCALCEQLGAAKAINYKKENFAEVLKTLFLPPSNLPPQAGGGNEKGIDVVLDITGGDNIQRNLSVLRRGGRMVSIAFLRGAKAEVHFGPLLTKHLSLIGSTLRSRSKEEKTTICNELKQNIWPKACDGTIFPVIDAEFALQEASQAHKRMEQNLNSGKILLRL